MRAQLSTTATIVGAEGEGFAYSPTGTMFESTESFAISGDHAGGFFCPD